MLLDTNAQDIKAEILLLDTRRKKVVKITDKITDSPELGAAHQLTARLLVIRVKSSVGTPAVTCMRLCS